MPSKTFHFGPVSEHDLADLFEHHIAVSSVLKASTSILADHPFIQALAGRALERADIAWVRVLRRAREEADDED